MYSLPSAQRLLYSKYEDLDVSVVGPSNWTGSAEQVSLNAYTVYFRDIVSLG